MNNCPKKLLWVFALYLLSVCGINRLEAQPFVVSKPIGLDDKYRGVITEWRKIESKHLAPMNIDSLLDEEKKTEEKDAEEMRKGKRIARPLQFATSRQVSVNLKDNGTWDILPDGSKVWRMRLIAPGAFSFSFIFDKFYLPKDAKFFIYNEMEKEQSILGAFTSIHNSASGQFATAPIQGSIVILEYIEPVSNRESGKISITSVALGYKNIFEIEKQITEKEKSANSIRKAPNQENTDENKTQGYYGVGGTDDKPCMANTDVNCPQFTSYSDIKRSVVAIYVNQGTSICSGAVLNRIGNSLYNVTPLILTAFHCLGGNPSTADLFVYRFKYERTSCGSSTLEVSDYYSGSTFLSGWDSPDFALIRLNTYPAAMLGTNIFMSGWTRSAASSVLALPLTGIHHPLSDVKKVVQQNQGLPSFSDPYISIVPNIGKLFRGSSGSPLYNNQKLIIGVAAGASDPYPWSDCSSRSALYGQIAASWEGAGTSDTRLKDHLDPFNSGAISQSGINLNTAWNGSAVLKQQIDDGSIIHSTKISPNPLTKSGSIGYSVEQDSKITLEVYDALMRKVGYSLEVQQQVGYHEQIIPVSQLQTGSYTVRITAVNGRNQIQVKSVILNVIH